MERAQKLWICESISLLRRAGAGAALARVDPEAMEHMPNAGRGASLNMTYDQPIGDRETAIAEEIRYFEQMAKRWEAKHHILVKLAMSPAFAAAILAFAGTLFTVCVAYRNSQIEAEKKENTLIIEALKADAKTPLSQLKVLVDAGLLPKFGTKLQQKLEEVSQNKTRTPAN